MIRVHQHWIFVIEVHAISQRMALHCQIHHLTVRKSDNWKEVISCLPVSLGFNSELFYPSQAHLKSSATSRTCRAEHFMMFRTVAVSEERQLRPVVLNQACPAAAGPWNLRSQIPSFSKTSTRSSAPTEKDAVELKRLYRSPNLNQRFVYWKNALHLCLAKSRNYFTAWHGHRKGQPSCVLCPKNCCVPIIIFLEKCCWKCYMKHIFWISSGGKNVSLTNFF